MKKLKSYLFLFLRIFITVSILYILFKKSDFEKLKSIFKGIAFPYYLLALLSFNTFQVLVALRWKIICECWGFKTKYLFYLKTYLMGFSLNTIFPGIIGSDILRAFFLTKEGLSWKKASLSVFFDRIFGLSGIFLILLWSLPLFGNFLPSKFYFFLIYLVYGTLLTAILGNIIIKKYYSPEYLKPVLFPCNVKPLFLGFTIQILFVLQFVFLSKALHLNLNFFYLFVIIPVVSFLAALPLSISGLGVREGTLSYFLSLLHYSLEYGISLGLLGYSLILISSLPGLYFYLRGKRLWKQAS
uniref:Flippase-like domain-containing protein n=1 Tax=Thermodesulfobacterium geofontis TaxID=1295609 RepID=A0A7V5XGB2_9BACT